MESTKTGPLQSPKLLGWVGLTLLALGFLSFALVHVSDAPDAQTIELAAGTGLLMALGVSTICIATIRRLEERVAALEARSKP
jgi:hypothetical protein